MINRRNKHYRYKPKNSDKINTKNLNASAFKNYRR